LDEEEGVDIQNYAALLTSYLFYRRPRIFQEKQRKRNTRPTRGQGIILENHNRISSELQQNERKLWLKVSKHLFTPGKRQRHIVMLNAHPWNPLETCEFMKF